MLVAGDMDVEVAILREGPASSAMGRAFWASVSLAFEQLPKNPLGPLILGGVAGAVSRDQSKQNPSCSGWSRCRAMFTLGGDGGVLAGLDGVLLRWKAKAVVPHRVKDVEALVTLVPGVDIGRDVSGGVPRATRPEG